MESSALPSQLVRLVDSIVDDDFAERLSRVFNTCAACIDALQNINLAPLEPTDAGDSSADLTMWESAAPAVASTVQAIHGLLSAIADHFSGRVPEGAFHGAHSDTRAAAEAMAAFQAVATQLKDGIEAVRTLSRDPRFVANRWALLAELQRLRGTFRARVGDAVFLAAAACGAARRDDVVPGAAQEVSRALVYRQTAAELVRQLRGRLAKPTDAATAASGVLEDVKLFVTMPAWKHVPAAPKRQLLELKLSLSQPTIGRDVVQADVEAFVVTIHDLSVEFTESVLVDHDRRVVGEVAEQLAQARLHLALNTVGAAAPLLRALAKAGALRGRDEAFDSTVRQLNRACALDQSPAELKASVAKLEAALG